MSLGVKKFVDYTSLSANEINQYLMQQSVMVFESAAARATAFTTAGVTVTEGMCSYLLDTNQFLIYNGATWVIPNAPVQNPTGLELIFDTAFSGTAAWLVDNVFTSTYQNYKVIVYGYGSSNSNVARFTLINSAGSELASNYYGASLWFDYATPTATMNVTGGTTFLPLGYLSTALAPQSTFTFDVTTPQISTLGVGISGTHTGVNAGVAFAGGSMSGTYNVATSMRGFYIRSSAGTNFVGRVSVYGYRNF